MSDASRGHVAAHLDAAETVTDQGRGRTALAVTALLAAAVPFVARVVLNVPGTTLAAVAESYGTLVAVATVGLALAAVGLAVGTADPVERIGLLALAVFAPLALIAEAAYIPAAGVVTAAASAVAWCRHGRVDTDGALPWVGRRLLAVGGIAAIATSLAATTGLAPVRIRHVGTVLALGAAVGGGAAADARAVDWAAGAFVASLVYTVGTFAPYVTGAVAIVAGGVVGASLPLLAAGVGGAVAATVTSLRRRALVPACGALLLLVGGVPVTVPRAMATALGVIFLLGRGGETA